MKAYFYSDTGLVARADSYHGTAAKWDVPLLDGYEYELLSSRVVHAASRSFRITPSILSRISQDPWDAIIIHSYTYPNDWLVWFARKLQGAPVLFYGDMYPVNNKNVPNLLERAIASPMKKMMVRGSDACLSISSVARDVLEALGVPRQRIFPAPYAVDNERFMAHAAALAPERSQLRSRLGLSPDLPVVLCVAGMVPIKRQQDLIEALARLDIPTQLVLVGGGPLLEDMRTLCKNRLPDCLLPGFVNQSALPEYYAASDIFVLPSTSETFGLVINEAMCFGLPIVASEGVAATRDLVCHGENGYIFPPGDVEALASFLEMLLVDDDQRRTFGERSREIVVGWSYDATVHGILRALEYVSPTVS
jgi:glycosyltransferase involved in cell wall biosynthesis